MWPGSQTTIPMEVRTQIKRDFWVFDLVSIDPSSPCPPERRTFGTNAVYGQMETTALEDYVDEIDEYPEFGNQPGVDGTRDPSRWDPETRAL